ncbi:hypothetical protein FA13DRAFT_1734982 [Coprinellus micaceus]|uniref:Uncharacterized protein n=1 Tax=Coprinellus micaceus TaxID=71717 RepID=A0A4Y7T547_COPMI|nr:hypothetical protein FA13DRAFT_1734982 [Coprinellus micaceus]
MRGALSHGLSLSAQWVSTRLSLDRSGMVMVPMVWSCCDADTTQHTHVILCGTIAKFDWVKFAVRGMETEG